MKRDQNNSQKLWLAGTIAFSGLLLMLIVICAESRSLWYDEVFSLDIVNGSWNQMLRRAKADVHPPLYYCILKIWLAFGGITGFNEIFLAKAGSFVPYLLIFFLSGSKIRKEHGIKTALLFELLIIGMPNLLNYALEIRSYSWALFFVTEVFLYGYEIVSYQKKSTWIYFTVYSTLAAYTHYFAAVSVIVIYFSVLLICRKEKIWKKWLLSVVCACIAYIPWLMVFVRQLGSVVQDYWIPEITGSTLMGYLKFLLEPPITKFNIGLIFGFSISLAYAILLGFQLRKKKKTRQQVYMLTGCAVALLTVFTGIIVSVIFRPVFVSRYMVPALGCFWMCLSWMAVHSHKKKVLLAVTFLTAVISIIDISQVVRWEEIRKGYYESISALWEGIPDEDMILTDNKEMKVCLEYYLPQNVAFVQDMKEVDDVYTNAENNSCAVWYFEVENDKSKRRLLLEMKQNYKLQDIGIFNLEYSRLEAYRIS